MIQFNLLPDIKIQYLRARRQKHLVLLSSVLVIVISVTALAVLISVVFGLQKKNISDLSKDIHATSGQLQGTRDLTKMLTVQNQLKSLTSLHDQKPVATRLFSYIGQATPAAASISKLNVDFAKHTITVSGEADQLETVNTYTDSLKFTTYHTSAAPNAEVSAFSDVVLSSFGRDSKGATYTITLAFDPIIFSEGSDVTLTVPNKVTTLSEVAKPTTFKSQAGQ